MCGWLPPAIPDYPCCSLFVLVWVATSGDFENMSLFKRSAHSAGPSRKLDERKLDERKLDERKIDERKLDGRKLDERKIDERK